MITAEQAAANSQKRKDDLRDEAIFIIKSFEESSPELAGVFKSIENLIIRVSCESRSKSAEVMVDLNYANDVGRLMSKLGFNISEFDKYRDRSGQKLSMVIGWE